MSSKLRKAIGAVKDQTSISLAKVSNNNSSNLDIAVLKATTHEEVPIDDCYVNEVLLLISSSQISTAACVQTIAKRISRTRSWIVALKSLMLILRIFQEGDPRFPRELLQAMKRGAKILNLASFRDDSNSSPWDYTSFIRTFALYLDERLDCFLMGKLQRRAQQRKQRVGQRISDMKPAMLLERISYWQRLLDRAIATCPTGAAKTNRLVHISLYSVVRESFDLYRDISDALSLLLDSFFQLQYISCINAFQTCVKASKQFEELCEFYSLCKSIGVGRTSEYPSVHKISQELVETLQQFLKDQASFQTVNGILQAPQLLLPAPPAIRDAGSCSEQSETSEQPEKVSEENSDLGLEPYEERNSLEDQIIVTNPGTNPSVSVDQEQYSMKFEKQSQLEDLASVNEPGTSMSGSVDQERIPCIELSFFDDRPQQEEEQQASVSGGDCWELVLTETASSESSAQVKHNVAFGSEPTFLTSLYDQDSPHPQQSNPFLQDTSENAETTSIPTSVSTAVTFGDSFSSLPTFQATPTFCAQNPNETLQIENDPFAPCALPLVADQMLDGSMNQQHVLHEQKLWLHHQNKIIAKHNIA